MKDLNEYINENLETINEVSMNPKNAEQCIQNSYEEDGDATSIGSCFQWLDAIDWKKAEKMDDKKLVNTIININSFSALFCKFLLNYYKSTFLIYYLICIWDYFLNTA